MANAEPLVRNLAGLEVEYRIVQIYCRDAGTKQAASTGTKVAVDRYVAS